MRRTKLFSVALLAAAWLAGGSAQALEQDANGYYLIGSKADLQEWIGISDYLSSKAKLIADIEDLDFMLSSAYFKGIFDGDGHTITLNNPSYPTGENKAIALFASTSGSTIKNLIVAGKITTGVKNSAGISTWNGGASTFENVVCIVEIDYTNTSDNASNGGFIGYCKQNATLNNCVAAPKYTGTKGNNNGFIGWRGGGTVTLNNCICICEAEGTADLNSVSLSNPSTSVIANNTYVVKMTYDPDTPVSNSVYVTKEQMSSGEIAYLINQAAGSNVFYQNLETDADAYPVPFDTHAVVYANGQANCDGSPKEGSVITYSNTDGLVQDAHVVVDGFCTVCHNVIVDYITPVDGVYPLATAKDMVWFAAMVNQASKSEINAKMTTDIDLTGVAYTPIGNSYEHYFNGTFDGQGHKISNLVINSDESTPLGLFGVVGNKAVLKNIYVDETCSLKGAGYVAGIAASGKKTDGTNFQVLNCVNAATVESTGSKASGIYAQDPAGQNSQAAFVIDNCVNAGNITAPGGGNIAASFCGWVNTNLCSIYNSFNIGTITNPQANNIMFQGKNRFMNNCYDLVYGIDESQQGYYAWKTAEPATNGELAAGLGCNFYQDIANDAYPIPFYAEGRSLWNKITEAGYSTFYAKEATLIPAGVTAYVGKINGKYLTLTAIEGTVIPAKTPVLLKGSAGIYEMKITTDDASAIADNDLQASEVTTNPDGTQYVLGFENAEIGFYKAAIGQSGKWNYMIAPGKAFLIVPEGSEIKGFTFAGDEATSINEVNGQLSIVNCQSIYNVAGQKLSKMQKGINIVNGKKILK